jgi:hypothetical protein
MVELGIKAYDAETKRRNVELDAATNAMQVQQPYLM